MNTIKMKKLSIILLSFILLSASDNLDETKLLIEYLEGENGGYVNNMGKWIINEADINFTEYLVLDLRSASDFALTPNPIQGAVNTTLDAMFDLVDSASSSKILVTCYSGQTASFGHMLLRLKGYEAYVMKFGMSWHDQSLDKWTDNCSDKNACDLVKSVSPELPTFGFPKLNTGKKTAEAILDERIKAAIALWDTLLINADEAIGYKDTFSLMNYWSEADYLEHGHIDGAYQLTPGTLTVTENLSAFDPVGVNIIYCYTGQSSAAITAYLTVLGYDIKSIKFGFNNMHWSKLPNHKWRKPFGD
jgi:rhodanese-related sulfurtransferase